MKIRLVANNGNRPIFLTALLGLAISSLAFFVLTSLEDDSIKARLDEIYAVRAAALEEIVEHQMDVLEVIRGLFIASVFVSREEFHLFTEGMLQRRGSIQALEWIPQVTLAERAAFEAERRRQFPGFNITQRETTGAMVRDDTREEYFPVDYVEPLEPNRAALGFNLGSNPKRRAALDKARDTGEIVATARITLVQENESQYAFLVFRPLYKGHPSTVAERRIALKGFMLGVFRIGDVFDAAIADAHQQSLEVSSILTDLSAPEEARLLHEHRISDQINDPKLAGRHELAVGGRTWLLISSPSMEMVAKMRSKLPYTTLLTGFLITALLVFYLRAMLHGRQEAERMSKHLNNVWSNIQDGIVTAGEEGFIESVNPAFGDIFGYRSEEVVGRPIRMLMPESLRDPHTAGMQRYLKKGTPHIIGKGVIRQQGLRKDGSVFPLELGLSEGVRDGKHTFIAVLRDISQRDRAEEILRENEQRMQQFFEASMEGLFFYRDGAILDVNSSGARMVGYEHDEIVGRNFLEFTAANLHELERLMGVANGESFESIALRKDGSQFPAEVRVRTVTYRDNKAVIVSLRDISERKRAEQEASRTTEELTRFIDTANAPIFGVDERGFINEWNKRIAAITGYGADAVMGCNLVNEFIGEDYQASVREVLRLAMLGEETENYELPLLTRTGAHLLILLNATTRRDIDGNIIGVIGVGQDITELESERKSLEHKVQQRTQELSKTVRQVEETNLQLQQADRARARFLSSMSHELRTPLNGILGFADLLNQQFFGALNEKQLRYVQQIDDSGKHLLALINDLLDMAKIDSGKLELALEPVDINMCMMDVKEMMGTQLRGKEIELALPELAETVSVHADPRKLKQIMLNLLSNAIKFSPTNTTIKIGYEFEEDAQIRVTVQDHGIGISPDQVDKIFSEFHQVDQVRDEQLGGTGIGLALTRRLVELHGGTIGVDSEEGQGSTFWFVLPLIPTASAGVADTKDAQSGLRETSTITARILVAEDNDTNLALLLDMLSMHETEVVVARNGQEAVDLALANPPDLILMDIRMPVMSGIDAAKRIRKLPDLKDIPMIALTASTGTDAEDRQIAAGFDEHLPKPIQSQMLFAAIRRQLEGGDHDTA